MATSPDPPKAGDTQFIVTVKDEQGRPVTDAEVTVGIFMAAMPSMNMPAMKSDGKLLHTGGGVYRGTVGVPMLGRWDCTITVLRDGQRIGSRQLGLVAQ